MAHQDLPSSVNVIVPILAPVAGSLQSKNIRIHKRRTSVRLEPQMWNALNEIARLEKCSIHDVCGAVHDLKEPETSFTAALRVFMMEYYRTLRMMPEGQNHITRIQEQVKIYKRTD